MRGQRPDRLPEGLTPAEAKWGERGLTPAVRGAVSACRRTDPQQMGTAGIATVGNSAPRRPDPANTWRGCDSFTTSQRL